MNVKDLVTQATAAPTRKVKYVGIAGAITTAAVALLESQFPGLGLGEQASPLIYSGLTALITFLAGYVTKNKATDR